MYHKIKAKFKIKLIQVSNNHTYHITLNYQFY